MIWSSTMTKIGLAVGALALASVGGAYATRGYMIEHDKRVTAEAVAKTEAAKREQLTGQIADLQKAMADRNAVYQTEVKRLETKFQSAATPQQLAALISQVMGLKQPIQITTPPPTQQNPNPQPVATVPNVDFSQVAAYTQQCEECKLNLTKTQADLADREAQMALADKQIQSLKTERDSWQQTAKGGSWLHRTVKALKYIGIGAGIGAVALCGSGHCK